jgi:hypothetical protein
MGYESTVQVIQRGGKNRQWNLICPAPLAWKIGGATLFDRCSLAGRRGRTKAYTPRLMQNPGVR